MLCKLHGDKLLMGGIMVLMLGLLSPLFAR